MREFMGTLKVRPAIDIPAGSEVMYPSGKVRYIVEGFCLKSRQLKIVNKHGVEYLIDEDKRMVIVDKSFNSDKPVKENDMAKLYQWKITQKGNVYTLYGSKLAVNSEGQAVMELKNTNKIMTVDQDQIEEVRPYTVDVLFLGGGNTSQKCSYYAKKGQVEVGDLVKVKSNGKPQIVMVKELDTNSNSATKQMDIIGKFALENS